MGYLTTKWWDYSESDNWPFILTKLFQVKINSLNDFEFSNDWGKVEKGVLTIYPEYAWDGCTPKKKVFGLMLGTPEGWKSITKRSSIIHDFLTQFDVCPRGISDKIFLYTLKDDKFKPAWVYYLAVRVYSAIFVNAKKWVSR